MTAVGIGAVGTFTSLGWSAALTVGAMNAGVQLFDDLSVRAPDGESVSGARILFPRDLPWAERLVTMALGALSECAETLPPQRPVPVILCLPETSEFQQPPSVILDGLVSSSPVALDPDASRAFPGGRAAIVEALPHALDLLVRGQRDACFLVGVDSLVTRDRLRRLVREGKILHDSNPAGFIPGEGAGCVFLTRRTDPETLAVVRGFGSARNHGAEQTPGSPASPAHGLTEAMRQALGTAGLRAADVGHLLFDFGEKIRFDELAMGWCRLPLEGATEAAELFGVAQWLGETGAAAGTLAMATAAFLIKKDVMRRPAMIALTSAGLARGAVILSARSSQKGGMNHG
jgi:3-oxoacyl-[acyl-carrier-protein] synthase I